MLQAGTTREEFINALQNPNFMTSPESQVDAGDRYGSGDKQSFSQGPYAQDNGDSSESFADARSRFAQRRPPQADGYGDRQMYKENADTYNINTPMDTDTRNYTDMSHRKEDLDLDSHNTNPYFSLDDDSAQGMELRMLLHGCFRDLAYLLHRMSQRYNDVMLSVLYGEQCSVDGL
ncbi:hypothetical protein SARC_14544 [Sphaeroforma arctica JP610]|uniref:Uncharacterized protein n=1 Tax=Sphaeroforma arctica JP610 TaxID=667725 RepID=A0A0L0F844_9EUKA|nr:hypothetical protein SARC_14544 [Sphaeroforma arctica JP610]KNC72895.1 hypothetical protein SARC_14544 [Sphaeroforma arctica JP610]|eukprot:XP_014146797.1 hypothetical protein SARC_14544 [Sphaeroforma arctica JP610]